MENYNNYKAPEVQFTKAEQKFIKNVTANDKENKKLVEDVMKESGIDINPEEDNKEYPINTLAQQEHAECEEKNMMINLETGENTVVSDDMTIENPDEIMEKDKINELGKEAFINSIIERYYSDDDKFTEEYIKEVKSKITDIVNNIDSIEDVYKEAPKEIQEAIMQQINDQELDPNDKEDVDIVSKSFFTPYDYSSITTQSIREYVDTCKESYGMKEKEALDFIEAIKQIRDNPDTKHCFKLLPKKMQDICKKICLKNNNNPNTTNLNTIARRLLGDALNTSGLLNETNNIEKEFAAAKKELNDNIMKEFSVEKDGVKIIEKEEWDYMGEIRKYVPLIIEKHPEKKEYCEQWLHNADMYEDAINLTSLKNDLINNEKCARRLDKHVRKAEYILRSFMNKYTSETAKTIYPIRNINESLNILGRYFSKKDYSDDVILAYFVLFCNHCMNYSPNNYDEAIYMYFSLKVLHRLEILPKDNEIRIKLINNLKEILDLIKSQFDSKKESEKNDKRTR